MNNQEKWKEEYAPLEHIPDTCYNDDLKDITIEELDSALADCPNGKAAGVSTVTYEMMKHIPRQFKEHVIKLYNWCLKSGLIPITWKQALLFAIPKPTDW